MKIIIKLIIKIIINLKIKIRVKIKIMKNFCLTDAENNRTNIICNYVLLI